MDKGKLVYASDAVPTDACRQVQWERDTAIKQLESYGVSFGEKAECAKIVRCKDCKLYHAEIGWCEEHSGFIDEDGEFCSPAESSNWKMFAPDEGCSRGERKDNG